MQAEALIIGAGPTGAVAAKRLAEAGIRVVVLEQGDWPDYSKARADHADFELTAGRDWAANPNRRMAEAGFASLNIFYKKQNTFFQNSIFIIRNPPLKTFLFD